MDQQDKAMQAVIESQTHSPLTWFFVSVSSVTLWLEHAAINGRRSSPGRSGATIGISLAASLIGAVLLARARPASAQFTPNSLAQFSIPASAGNTTGFAPSSVRFGPNGQLYIWDGSSIYEQTGGYNAGVINMIGSITSGGNPTPYDSDPGPINFSQNGQSMIVSEGAGGYDASGVESNGLMFALPITGGTTITPIGADPDTFDLIPKPGSSTTGSSASKFFINVGTSFGSEVDLFNASTDATVPILTSIPGASSSLAISGTNWSNYTLYVGIGYGAQQGAIESFKLSALFQALKSGTALSWGATAATVVNPGPDYNNSGAGMFVDPRGYVFTGGSGGIEVIGPTGGPSVYSIPYDNSGDMFTYASVSYNSITNQFAVQGYDSTGSLPVQQTVIYSASQFGVAATNLLNWTGTNSAGGMNRSWDATTGSTNWASNSSTVTYSEGDTVIFGDTNPYNGTPVCNNNGKASVTIASGGVNPAAVMFTNSGAANGGVDYTICGGPIGGTATLELYGNGTVGGTVNLMSPNAFTGPVVVAAGTLNLQSTAALGNSSGVSVIAGATLQLQGTGPGTFGLTVRNSNSIPLNLYGTGITASTTNTAAGELNSFSGNNIYAGAINVGSGGGQIVSTSTAGSDQLTLSGGVNIAAGSTLNIAGPGKTTIAGNGLTIGNSGSVQVNSGTLEFNLVAGTGSVTLGSGTTLAVAAGATLQLAGTVSALYDPVSGNRVNVVYQGSTADAGGLTIAGGNQSVGTISGTPTTESGVPTTYSGDTVVAAGASLTADQILQNTLTIGAGATVTIHPSGPGISTQDTSDTATAANASAGNAETAIQSAIADTANATLPDETLEAEQLENRVAVLTRLAAADPAFDLSLAAAENSLQSLRAEWPGTVSPELFDEGDPADANANGLLFPAAEIGGIPTPVPEPPTAVLFLLASCILFPALRRSKTPRK